MTRKDYIKGVEVYAQCIREKKWYWLSKEARAVRTAFVYFFQQDNAGFNREVFLTNCESAHYEAKRNGGAL